MQLPIIDDYYRLFIDDAPLLDVRAPVEFNQGAFPHAQNLPLLNDEERHAIGIRYAEAGQDQAIALGQELVRDGVKDQRIQDWYEFTQQYPNGALYCFRGGLRSKITQQWLYESTGVVYPRVEGGYKALRRFLINELETAMDGLQTLVIGGRTGVGKTLLLQRLEHQLDLEGIYRHRGSSFGYRVLPQPSQIDIENSLAIALLKHRNNNVHKLVLEDEAPNIGSRSVPPGIMHSMRQAPLVLIEENIENRVNAVFEEYINSALAEFQQVHGEALGFEHWANNLHSALDRIQRRLGDQRHRQLIDIMDVALEQQRRHENRDNHKSWIRILLQEYYDPMYDYQLQRKAERIIFRGDREAVHDYLVQQHGVT